MSVDVADSEMIAARDSIWGAACVALLLSSCLVLIPMSVWGAPRAIVFWSNRDRPETHGDVFVVKEDGTDLVNLTADLFRGGVWTPQTSRDGNLVAFAAPSESGVGEIWVMGSEGEAPQMVTDMGRWASRPYWSPDGRTIVFRAWSDREEARECEPHVYYNGCFDIYTTGLTATKPRNITQTPEFNYFPSWSPDGSQIAYVRESPNGDGDLWVLEVGNESRQQITHEGQIHGSAPSWSPDSRRIAVGANLGDRQSILLMERDGTGVVNVSHDRQWEVSPAWSHDGRTIAYVSWKKGGTDIWLMNADGTQPRKVTDRPAHYGSLSWLHVGVDTGIEDTRWGELKRQR